MKKRIFSLLLACMMVCAMIVPAQAATASLSGGSNVKPGETVTLTLSVSGNIEGFQSGAVSCSSNLTYTGYSSAKSDWIIDSNQGTSFLGYDKDVVADSGSLMTLTFKVSSSAKAGDSLSVKLADVILASSSGSSSATTLSWTGSVAAPPSNNCDLKAIECYSGTMTPKFDKNTTYYTVTVPYEVEKLSFDYFRADQTQKVTVSGGKLVVGENTITFVVKAASGATKTYTLVATREQDPNYVPSDDASLKEMTVEGATLSPAFDPSITEYVAYVPFEQRELTLKGVPNDEKAGGVAEKKVELDKAENIPAFEPAVDEETGTFTPVTTYAAEEKAVQLVCTAEDGVTQQAYTIHIIRMPAYTGGVPQIHMTNEEDLAVQEELPEEERPYEVPKTLELPLVGEMATKTAAIIGGAVAVVLMLLIGFLLGRIGRGKAVYEDDYEDDDDEPVDEPAVLVMAPAKPERPAKPVKAEKPAKPSKKAKAFDYDEDDEFERRLEQVVAAEHKLPEKAPEAPAEPPKPVKKPEPAPKTAPTEDDLSRMSLDDLLNDIKNM